MTKIIQLKTEQEARRAAQDIKDAAEPLLGLIGEHLPTSKATQKIMENLNKAVDDAIRAVRESYKNFGGKKRPT